MSFTPEQRQEIAEIVTEELMRQGLLSTEQIVLDFAHRASAKRQARAEEQHKAQPTVAAAGEADKQNLMSLHTVMKELANDNDVPYEKVKAIMLAWVKLQYLDLTEHEAQ
jgi:hypothetical protein